MATVTGTVTIEDPIGFHARPAGQIVKLVKDSGLLSASRARDIPLITDRPVHGPSARLLTTRGAPFVRV